MYNDVILTRLSNLEQADEGNDSSSDDDNEELRAAIQDLRNEMTALQANAGTNTAPEPHLPELQTSSRGLTGVAPAPTSRISTVDQEDERPSRNARQNPSSSRRLARSSRRDSRKTS